MTSQATQIQTLINEIDAALNKTSTRLPWVMSGEAMQQRRVLEQTRQYLLSLQEQAAVESAPPQTAPAPSPTAAEESAQHVLQAVLQEMGYLRSHILQPLRADIDRLHQEREALNAEIKQLQEQRQQALPPQSGQQQIIEDFMRSLMSRVQEQLAVQVTQTVANFSVPPTELPGASMGVLAGGSDLTTLTPEQRIAQVQKLQAQSDQLLLKLDSTLRVIFESLQTNMQGYQESLGQGLEKMHSLGQQGEAMFAALVNRLAQQLGREASSYLQSSFQAGEWKPVATSQLLDASSLQPLNSPGKTAPDSAASDEISDGQIDQLLEELKAGGVTVDEDVLPPPAQPAPQISHPAASQTPASKEDIPEAIAPMADEEEPLPLEPIAEWEVSDEEGLSWSPDDDLDTLDAAFDIIGDTSFAGGNAPEADHSAEYAAESDGVEDEFYQSLFGADFAEPEELEPDATNAPSAEGLAIATPSPISLEGFADEFDLFGGLADPAESPSPSTPEDMPRRDEALSELSTQALEGVLFPNTEPLFSEEQFADSLSAPVPEDTLDDQPFLEETSDESETYTLAPPEEDLLSDDVPEQVATVDLDLDDGTLDQLTADLQALESASEPYTLSGFGEAIAPAPSAEASVQAEEPLASPSPTPPPVSDRPENPLHLIGLETTPSEPRPQIINDGTLTQPTLDSFFAGITEDDQDAPPIFQDAPPIFSEESSETIDLFSNASPVASSDLENDLNLIWEAFDSPAPATTPTAPQPADSPASEDRGWTLNDAFAEVDPVVSSEAPSVSFSAGDTDRELTLGDFGAALDAPEATHHQPPTAQPSITDFSTDAHASSANRPTSNTSEPEGITLGNYFDTLNGVEEPAPEAASLESILEEQDIFTLDHVTLENLFEDLPDGLSTGGSKKK